MDDVQSAHPGCGVPHTLSFPLREEATKGDAVPEISVVVPLYDEQENIQELHRRLSESLTSLGVSYELVFINDGTQFVPQQPGQQVHI